MAIDIKCPHCAKPYRLKDEMVGKKVQCANQECRKPFPVEPPAPAANGTPKKPAAPPPPAAPPKKPVDADELAAQALADAERAANPTLSVIHMTCSMCEHKWDVPVEMQGKNVLCPDCKHRQKVPIPKDATKQDWRVRQGPQGAKLDRLEGVQANTDASSVSGQTLLATGVVKIEYEPRPASFYVKIAAGVLVPLVLLGGFLLYSSRTKREVAERVRFEALIKDSADDLKALPVYRGVLRAAAARYEATLGQPAGGKTEASSRDKAVADVQQGVGDLKEVAKGYDRDFLFGELASAAILLGGEGEDLKEKRKLSWLPPTAGSVGKNQIRPNAAELLGVQGQLRQVFEAMAEKGGDFDARAAVARRIARELLRENAPAELIETFAQPGFSLPELFEVDGQVGLECLRAGKADLAKQIAERLKGQLTAINQAAPPAVSAQALMRSLDITPQADFTAGGSNTDAARMVQVLARLGQNKPDEAVNLAKGGTGPAADRFRALAAVAEGTDQPQPAVEAANGLVTAVKNENVPTPVGVAAYRLACAAARCGADPEPFLGLIADETLGPWARAEALRLKLAADKSQQPGVEAANLPTEPRNFRGGHAWAALAIARHNASKTGENKLLKEYAGWPKPFGYFGQAGAALGLLERGK